MAKKKVKEEEVKKEETQPEVQAEPEVVNEEPKIEEPKECPDGACQELADIWDKGEGCYDANSKWCQECEKEFADVAKLCKARTERMNVGKKEKKSATRSPRRARGNVNKYNHGINTQAGKIDELLEAGNKLDDIVSELIEAGLSSRDKTTTKRRVLGHIAHLEKVKAVKIEKKGGVYKIAA